jgi:hypothetical protein
MLWYEYINKEWIVSPTARRVYRVAATASLGLPVFLVVVQIYGQSLFPRPVLRLIFLVGVLGTALTIVGMEYFLFRFDNSHPLKQVLWFCVMAFIPLGPALYCFFAYSRSDMLKRSCTKPMQGISG